MKTILTYFQAQTNKPRLLLSPGPSPSPSRKCGPRAYTKITWATTTPPITFKHEGVLWQASVIIQSFSSNVTPVRNLILDPIRNHLCKKKFLIRAKIPPTFAKLLFALALVKSKKKNLTYYDFLNFFFQNIITFGETIPKRYNTWGHRVVLHISGGCGGAGRLGGVARVGFLT